MASMIEPNTIYNLFLAFLPGILAFVIYRSLSDKDFGNVDKLDYLIIVFFALLVESVRSITPERFLIPRYKLFVIYIISGILFGILGNIVHRLYLNYFVTWYEENLISKIGSIQNTDTAEVSRWNTVLDENIPNNMSNLGKAQYIEVDTEDDVKKGFLVGYSSTDLEIISYDKIDKTIIGQNYNPKRLKRRTEVINKDSTIGFEVFNMELSQFVDLDS